MNNYERIYELLTETRSAASRARTTARKEDAERKKRKKGALQGKGKSMQAYGYGKKAAKNIATAKTYRSAADELTSHAKTNPGPNPSRRRDVTATAVHAVRSAATQKERAATSFIKAGKQAAGNKRAVNRTLKRDETMKNLAKLTIRGN